MIDAMKQALEALEQYADYEGTTPLADKAITSLRLAIEQAEKQEPVAWDTGNRITELKARSIEQRGYKLSGYILCDGEGRRAIVEMQAVRWLDNTEERNALMFGTAPPQRQPLTDAEIWKFWWDRPAVPDGEDDSMEAEFVAACRRVLAAHGIGGEHD